MLISRITLFALFLGTAPVAAETRSIDWLFPTWPVGSTFHMSSDGTPPETHTTVGRDTLGYRVDVTAKDGTLNGTYWTDEHGQTTAWRGGGSTDTDLYVPNDCTATLGACHYVEQPAGGEGAARIRTTTLTDEGIEFRVTDEAGVLILTGAWNLDEQGFVTSGWNEFSDGGRSSVAMIGIAIKAD